MLKHRFAGGLLQHNALIGSYLMFLMLYCNLIPFWNGKVVFQSNQGSFVALLFTFQFAFQFWGTTFTPALLSSLEASSGSKGDGMGRTGRSWGENSLKTEEQGADICSPWCWSPCAGDSCGCAASCGTWLPSRRARSGSRCRRCACPPCGFSGCGLTGKFFHSEGRAWGLSPWPSSFRASHPLKQWPLSPRASQRLKNNQEIC